MKKLLALLLLALCPLLAHPAANSMLLEQRNSTNTGNVTRIVDFPATDGVFWYNTTTNLPSVMTLGANMALSSGVLDSVPPTWSTLASKPTFATVAFSGAYGDLSGAPSVVVVQRTRAQTNTSGVLTWTFPSAYGGGVTPIISLTVEDATAGVTWNDQITAISNTSVTIQLTKTTAVTVLGISVLGVAATPQAFVHLMAVAP